VEKHLTSEPQGAPENIENTQEEKKGPETKPVDVPATIHPNVEQSKPHVSPKKNENIVPEHFKPTAFKTEKLPQPFDNQIRNNVVESVFQQTIDRDRESEMNKLFEDEKGSKKALSIEDFIEHFMKGVQVCPKVTYFTYAASKSPEKQQIKPTHEKYIQPSSSTTSTTSSSTNKNFPQKSPFGQQQHFPEYNMGYGQHPMMYPWIPNPEVNPQLYQQYQQMMPMFYQMFNPMMYQQQVPEGENYEGSKGQKNQPKNYSNMPMPQMGYPNYSGENQNFYGGGGTQKNEEQSNFQNYYYGNK